MAVVIPVLLLLMCGLIVGGIGVFRYQQVGCIAREGARWASVRGADYAADTGLASPTTQQIISNGVLPLAVSMDPTRITVQVEWIDQSSNTAWNWDASPKNVRSITATGEYVTNTVQVTVTYVWSPGIFWDPMTLQSVTQMPMSN
jgi:Flp pilus assembly protein TadG